MSTEQALTATQKREQIDASLDRLVAQIEATVPGATTKPGTWHAMPTIEVRTPALSAVGRFAMLWLLGDGDGYQLHLSALDDAGRLGGAPCAIWPPGPLEEAEDLAEMLDEAVVWEPGPPSLRFVPREED